MVNSRLTACVTPRDWNDAHTEARCAIRDGGHYLPIYDLGFSVPDEPRRKLIAFVMDPARGCEFYFEGNVGYYPDVRPQSSGTKLERYRCSKTMERHTHEAIVPPNRPEDNYLGWYKNTDVLLIYYPAPDLASL